MMSRDFRNGRERSFAIDQGRERKSQDKNSPRDIAKESIAFVLLLFSAVHHVCNNV